MSKTTRQCLMIENEEQKVSNNLGLSHQFGAGINEDCQQLPDQIDPPNVEGGTWGRGTICFYKWMVH